MDDIPSTAQTHGPDPPRSGHTVNDWEELLGDDFVVGGMDAPRSSDVPLALPTGTTVPLIGSALTVTPQAPSPCPRSLTCLLFTQRRRLCSSGRGWAASQH